jgi:hypothetical protein
VTLPDGRVVRSERFLFDPQGVMVLRRESGRLEELAPFDAPSSPEAIATPGGGMDERDQ